MSLKTQQKIAFTKKMILRLKEIETIVQRIKQDLADKNVSINSELYSQINNHPFV